MNLSNIKLVVSDMDGTLLNSKGEVSPQFFKIFNQLQKQDIHFIAASGRQYNSIANKLQKIKNQITIIAENGGLVKENDQLILMNKLSSKKIKKIIPILRTIKGANYVLCGENAAFIESKDEAFIQMFKEYYTNFNIVEDLMELIGKVNFLKIAVYHSESSEKYIFPKVHMLNNDVLIKISGQHWLDLSEYQSNKGFALKLIQEKKGISKEQTMVFGDYHNDIEMMSCASYRIAMKNAHPDVKSLANFQTASNDEYGVEKVLEKLIQQ